MWVEVFDEKYSLNMATGKNFDKVLRKVEPLVDKKVIQFLKSCPSYITFEDLKQEVWVITISLLKAFDKTKGTKLSTFLTSSIETKLISLVRSLNRMKDNASFLHEDSFDPTIFNYAKEAFPLSKSVSWEKEECRTLESLIPSSIACNDDFSSIDFRLSLDSLLAKYSFHFEEDVRKFIENILFKDDTLADAGKHSALSDWALSAKLKRGARYLEDLKIKTVSEEALPANSDLQSLFYF